MMLMFKKIFFLLILLFSNSCSFISKKIDQLEENEKTVYTKKIAKEYCKKTAEIQLLTKENENLAIYNQERILSYLTNKNESFINKTLFLQLINFASNPHSINQDSRVQILIKNNEDLNLFEFYSIQNQSPNYTLFYALDFISNKYRKRNILDLVNLVQSILPDNLIVNEALSNFLLKNNKNILISDKLKVSFQKGDEILRKGESFKRINLVSEYNDYIRNIHKKFNIKTGINQFFNFKQEHKESKCNFKIEDDKLTINQINSENLFYDYLLFKDKNQYFTAIYSSTLNTTKSSPDSLLIQGPSLPICLFRNEISKNMYVLFSPDGRDSSQHLKHLHEYELYEAQSLSQLADFLRFPRHLFLSSPDRVLYESKLGRKEQLDFFLSLNFPIYHVEDLGIVNGVAVFEDQKANLISDFRSNNGLLCL